jgi:zinc protease
MDAANRAAVIALLCTCAGSTRPNPKLPWPGDAPTRLSLSNGATAILLADPDADFTTVLVRYEVGAIDDPPGSEGMADLASHLTYGLRAGKRTLWDELDHVAIGIEDFPGESTTELVETTTADHLHEVLRLEAERIAGGCAHVEQRDLDYSRQLVHDEAAGASWAVRHALRHALVPDGDPGQRRFDATPEKVDALASAKLCDFIASHYVPANLTLVVSGPVSPATFDKLASETIGAVHGHAPAPRPAVAAAMQPTGSVTIATGIGVAAAIVAWPLPADQAERVRMTAAVRVLAKLLDLQYLVEDHLVLLGQSEPRRGVDDLIARVSGALAGNSVSHDDLVHAIEARRTLAIARYDDPPSRVRAAADPDSNADVDALQAMTPESWKQTTASVLAWSRARIIVMQPDGHSSRAHALDLNERAHPLRGSLAHDAKEAGLTVPRSTVLGHARTFKLDTGLNVVLARTTIAPVVDIELAFEAGETDEDHPGTARVAIRALDAIARRGVPTTAEADSFAGALEERSMIRVFGEARHADMLIRHFAGLGASAPTADDVKAARDDITALAPAAQVRFKWDRAARVALYGADHRDAKQTEPTKDDLATVDTAAVAGYVAKFLRPSNATLVITGGFDPADAEKLVRATFAGWRDDGSPVQRPTAAAHGGAAMLAIEDQSLDLYLDVSWRATPGDDSEATRVLVAGALQSLSSRIESGFEWRRDGGRYRMVASFPVDKYDAIARVFHDLPGVNPDKHLSPEAFASNRRHVIATRAGGRRDAESWAEAIADALGRGHDVPWLDGQLPRFSEVTYEKADALATSELTRDRMVWLVAGPKDAVTAVYQQIGEKPQWITP